MAGKIPTWLNGFLRVDDLAAIEAAIEHAEIKTSGEIVPMIVRSSSTMGYLPNYLFIFLSMITLLFINHAHTFVLMGAIVASAALAFLLARLSFVQRLVIPKRDQIQDVHHRAHFEFFEHGLGRTEGKTGVLIFVSLMEHRCVVLADKGISQKVKPEIWDDVVSTLTEAIKNAQAGDGFVAAIKKCGEVLAEHFPAKGENPNELRNNLIIEP